jgi:hypothetical protein
MRLCHVDDFGALLDEKRVGDLKQLKADGAFLGLPSFN